MRTFRSERGANLAEYSLLFTGVLLLSLAALQSFGEQVNYAARENRYHLFLALDYCGGGSDTVMESDEPPREGCTVFGPEKP